MAACSDESDFESSMSDDDVEGFMFSSVAYGTTYSKVRRMRAAKFLLKSQLYRAIVLPDDQPDVYDIVKSHQRVSKLMFPMVVKAIKTGSRAEQLYLVSSDIDYMYEVGPLIVSNTDQNWSVKYFLKEFFKRFQVHSQTGIESFKSESTKHTGFYSVHDSAGGCLYPVVMQTKLAPIIANVKQLALLKKTYASLQPKRDNSEGKLKSNEDVVIALKCSEWPTDVWECFSLRNPKSLEHIMEELKEKNLYLVPKSHPSSENPWIEWRLSFSLVETKIMLSIPYLFRKVLLCCKALAAERWGYSSYILKTVFLWKYEERIESGRKFSEDDLFEMIREVFFTLWKYYKNGNVPHYFLPNMNLLDFYSKEEKENGMANFMKRLSKLAKVCGLRDCVLSSFSPFYPIKNAEPRFPHEHLYKQPSYNNLYHLFSKYYDYESKKTKTQTDDHMEILCEIYYTYLFILHQRFISIGCFNRCMDHTFQLLYALKVFGAEYFDEDLHTLGTLCESVNEFFKMFHREFSREECAINMEPYLKFLSDKLKQRCADTDVVDTLHLKQEKLLDMWETGELDETIFSKLTMEEDCSYSKFAIESRLPKKFRKKKIFEYGDRHKSEEIQTKVQTYKFWQLDSKFSVLAEKLSDVLYSNLYDRMKQEKSEVNTDGDLQRYLLRRLPFHQFEMFNYGFTPKKFCLPTPGLYIEFLSQLSVNCGALYKVTKLLDPAIDHRPDVWGYITPHGSDFTSYRERKHNSFIRDWEFLIK